MMLTVTFLVTPLANRPPTLSTVGSPTFLLVVPVRLVFATAGLVVALRSSTLHLTMAFLPGAGLVVALRSSTLYLTKVFLLGALAFFLQGFFLSSKLLLRQLRACLRRWRLGLDRYPHLILKRVNRYFCSSGPALFVANGNA